MKGGRLEAGHPVFTLAAMMRSRWSEALSRAMLDIVSYHLGSPAGGASYVLMQMVSEQFSLRMSPAILPDAQKLFDDQPTDRPPVYRGAIRRFVDILRFRHDMLKEIEA